MASSVTRKLIPASQSRASAQRLIGDFEDVSDFASDKRLLYLFDYSPRRAAGVSSLGNGPPHNQIIRARTYRFCRRHDAGLVARFRASRADAGRDNQEIAAGCLADGSGLMTRRDDAIKASLIPLSENSLARHKANVVQPSPEEKL